MLEGLLSEPDPSGCSKGEAMLRAAITRAIGGDNVALGLLLDRTVPRLRPADEPTEDRIVKSGLSILEKRALAGAAHDWLRNGGPRPDAQIVLNGEWRPTPSLN